MSNNDKKLLFLAFLFAFVPALLCPVAWPWLRISFFSPFLALMIYKRPLASCLWFSVLCGLVMDLFSARARLGLYAINYCITTSLLFSRKGFLFEDKISTLPLMTMLFSVMSTLLQALALKMMTNDFHPSWLWALTDLVAFPCLDAVYALGWFALPAYLLRRRPTSRNSTLCLRPE